MDINLLSRVMASGDASSLPDHVRTSPSKPNAFHNPLSSSGGNLSPSPTSERQSLATTIEEAIRRLPPFTPYSAQVPWHTGMRALFSHMFPKYGHYCGPNWSSGRSSGSLLWDKPPIDWLDHCCYCHDVGYDSYDQARLYKADLELLECLQKMPPPKQQKKQNEDSLYFGSNKDSNENLAWFYRSLYITGLQTFLLPYRRLLIRDFGKAQAQE